MTENEANNFLERLASSPKDRIVETPYNFIAKIAHPIKENQNALLIGLKILSYQNISRVNQSLSNNLTNIKNFEEDIFYEFSDEIELLSCLGTTDGKFKRHDFIEGGISISSQNALNLAGTLGGLFSIENDDNIYLITNAHVLKFGGIEKDKNIVVHPAVSDEKEQNRIEIGEIIWMSDYTDNVDAAIVKLFQLNNKLVIRNSTRCDKIHFNKLADPIEGEKVRKCGRTTGYKEGKIISDNCLLITKEGIKFKNQIITTLLADSGDSGSILSNFKNEAVGLLYAKNKNCSRNFANPLKPVFNLAKEQIPEFEFHKFITKTDITMETKKTVERGNTTKSHQLIKYENGEEIWAKFTKWDDQQKPCPIKIEITKNAAQHEIIRIDCINNRGCNELQIKYKKGDNNENFTAEIDNCDLLDTQVISIQFEDGDDYETIKCSSEYDTGSTGDIKPIPDVKKGNILQGNP